MDPRDPASCCNLPGWKIPRSKRFLDKRFLGRHSSLLFSVCSVLVLLFKFFFFSSFEASEISSEFRRTFILATRNLAPFATMLQMCKNVCSLQQEISHLHYLRISFALSPLYSSCILQPSIRLIWRICRIHFGGNQGGSSYDSIEMELKRLLIRIIIIRNWNLSCFGFYLKLLKSFGIWILIFDYLLYLMRWNYCKNEIIVLNEVIIFFYLF